jgi:hypothetical protein
VSGAAIGAGIGGLAALAALLLLLFLFKRKKPADMPEEAEEETAGSDQTVNLSDGGYISEYGLSDGVRPVDSDEDDEDLPQAGPGDGNYDSDLENASEHNPDELDEVALDPDEA